VTGGCDEVEQDVDTVIPEAGVTLNPGLLCKNVIVLALEVANNLAETVQKLATELTSISLGAHAWPHCQSGHRIRGYRRWSRRCGFPPHRVRALSFAVSVHGPLLAPCGERLNSPTVTGLMRTPSSR
jgi:hypothetical protein